MMERLRREAREMWTEGDGRRREEGREEDRR